MVRKGARVAPPAARGEWELRHASKGAADGWEQLAKQAPGPLREAWERLSASPRDPSNHERQHRLRGTLSIKTVKGTDLEQWQYEVTGGGRIWYCPDDGDGIVWITHAGTGHPSATS